MKAKFGFLNKGEKDFPPMVILKITNTCNLACIHCPHRVISKTKAYTPKHMGWSLYEKIVQEVSGYKNTIFRLLSDGEPLCHPKFLDMLRLAKSKGIGPVNFITNGLLLNEEVALTALELGVETIEISLDALKKESYERIRVGSNFDLVMSNVHSLIALKHKMKSRTKVLVSIIDQPEVKPEIDNFVQYWAPKVDKVLVREYTTIGGLVKNKGVKKNGHVKRWPCPQLWRRFFINLDGFSEFCVEDWNSQTAIGNLAVSSIKQIWNSAEYQNIRRLHLENRFEEVPYCNECSDWHTRQWGYDYFYALEQILGNKC